MIFTLTVTQLIFQMQAKFDTKNKRIFFVTDEYGLLNHQIKKEFSLSLVYTEKCNMQPTKKYIIKKLQTYKFKNNIYIEILSIISHFLLSRLKSILLGENILLDYVEQRLQQQPIINLIKEYAQKEHNFCSTKNEKPTKKQVEKIINEIKESDVMINNFLFESSNFISIILGTNDHIFREIADLSSNEALTNFLIRHLPDNPSQNDISYMYQNFSIFYNRIDFQNYSDFTDTLNNIVDMDVRAGLIHYIFIKLNCEYYIIKCLEEVFRYKRLSNMEFRKKVSTDIRKLHLVKKIFNQFKIIIKNSNNGFKILFEISYSHSQAEDECRNFFRKKNIKKNDLDLYILNNYVDAYTSIGKYIELDENPTQKYESELNKKIEFLADEVYKEDKTTDLNKTSKFSDRRVACQNHAFDKYVTKEFTCYRIEENESELENS